MSFPANVIPVFGSQRAYADLNFAGGSFGLNGTFVNDVTRLSGYSFTRASLATMFDSTGKLTYGPNNLLVRSQKFGTTWVPGNATVVSNTVAAPDGTLTADTLVSAASTAATYAQQALTPSAANHVFSTYVKAATGVQYVQLLWASSNSTQYANFDISGGTVTAGTYGAATITPAGNGWYRISINSYLAGAAGAVNIYIIGASGASRGASFAGDGTSGIYLWGAQLEAVTYQTTPSTYYPTTSAAYYGARLVYDPVTLASLGILVEEARTNLCLQSQTFDNASWAKTAGSVTANAAIAPDGTANAAEWISSGSSGTYIRQNITVTAATAYTVSIYLKASVNSWALFEVWNSGTTKWSGTYINLATGALGSTTSGGGGLSPTWSVQTLPNGWYRLIVALTSDNTTLVPVVYVAAANNNLTVSNGASVYLWQAQLE